MNAIKTIITAIISWEAKTVLKKYSPRIIGITGSVGKSSTKEAIAVVLSQKYSVRTNKKSYNSRIGLSLAVLGLETGWRSPIAWSKTIMRGVFVLQARAFPDICVLEMGVDRPRDMDALLAVARPHIGVVSAIGNIPVHVEFFSDPEEIIREKSKLIKALPTNGFAVLNADDEATRSMRDDTKAKIVTYGFSKEADMIASQYKVTADGVTFKVDYNGVSVPVRLSHIYGRHQVYPILAAMLVGTLFDINLIDAASSLLTNYQSLPGRLRLIEGVKESTIFDDTYNASPLAVHAALDMLNEITGGRKIVVLGDMLEIGKYTIPAHEKAGKQIASFADYFIAIGPRAKCAADAALGNGMVKNQVFVFSTALDAISQINDILKKGDMILVKGSQSMRMERIVEAIMSYPERAPQLLCRQDEYWKNKK